MTARPRASVRAAVDLAGRAASDAGLRASGSCLGMLREPRTVGPDAAGSSLRDWIADWRPRVRAALAAALRGGAAAVAITTLGQRVAVAVLFAVDYAHIITPLRVAARRARRRDRPHGGAARVPAEPGDLGRVLVRRPGLRDRGRIARVAARHRARTAARRSRSSGRCPPAIRPWGSSGCSCRSSPDSSPAPRCARRCRERSDADDDREQLPHWPRVTARVGGGRARRADHRAARGDLGRLGRPGTIPQVGPDALAVGLRPRLEFAVAHRRIGLGGIRARLPSRRLPVSRVAAPTTQVGRLRPACCGSSSSSRGAAPTCAPCSRPSEDAEFPARVVASEPTATPTASRTPRSSASRASWCRSARSTRREAWGDEFLAQLRQWEADLVILSGFMRLLPPRVVAALARG